MDEVAKYEAQMDALFGMLLTTFEPERIIVLKEEIDHTKLTADWKEFLCRQGIEGELYEWLVQEFEERRVRATRKSSLEDQISSSEGLKKEPKRGNGQKISGPDR